MIVIGILAAVAVMVATLRSDFAWSLVTMWAFAGLYPAANALGCQLSYSSHEQASGFVFSLGGCCCRSGDCNGHVPHPLQRNRPVEARLVQGASTCERVNAVIRPSRPMLEAER